MGRHIWIFLCVLIALKGCGGGEPSAGINSSVDILDYRSAYIYEADSSVNKLLIGIESRIVLKDNGDKQSFLLLKDHPRESTFDPRVDPYSEIMAHADGASFISFTYGVESDLVVVKRRYARVSDRNIKYLEECRKRGNSIERLYTELSEQQVEKVNYQGAMPGNARNGQYFGKYEYRAGSIEVRIDFPVALINNNPLNDKESLTSNTAFQIVSSQFPLYIPNQLTLCDSIRPGYLAIRSLDGSAQAVYMCRYEKSGTVYHDYGCLINLVGTFSIYRLR